MNNMITDKKARLTKLSENFTLWEFIKSDIAISNGLMPEQFKITKTQINNAKLLCRNILQPLRDYLGEPVTITSGFRSKLLNSHPKLNGSKTSDHLEAKASDIETEQMEKAYEFLKTLDFDQLINEIRLDKNGKIKKHWIHVSYRSSGNRKMRFEIRR